LKLFRRRSTRPMYGTILDQRNPRRRARGQGRSHGDLDRKVRGRHPTNCANQSSLSTTARRGAVTLDAPVGAPTSAVFGLGLSKPCPKRRSSPSPIRMTQTAMASRGGRITDRAATGTKALAVRWKAGISSLRSKPHWPSSTTSASRLRSTRSTAAASCKRRVRAARPTRRLSLPIRISIASSRTFGTLRATASQLR
jgi:hypothetical protein